MASSAGSTGGRLALGLALAFVAFNARPALSSLGPVLPEALSGAGMTHAQAAWLTTLPVLCLGLFGLLGPRIGRWLGAERAVFVLMLALVGAIAVRIAGTATSLVVGCALGAAAIGAVNVLLPGVVKRDFPDQAPRLMGVYTMALVGGAATAAGTTAPLARVLGGYAEGLAFWAAPALAAALAWGLATRRTAPVSPAVRAAVDPVKGLWTSPLAWSVTLFTGLQSSQAYVMFGWMAPILRDHGFEAITAGYVTSISILTQVPAALAAPAIAARGRDQRGAVALFILLSLLGDAGVMFGQGWIVWPSAVLMGLGQGGVFAVALTVIVLRARDAREAAALSSMAQGVGYTVAAAGPLLAGVLRDVTGGWAVSGVAVLAIVAAAGVFGWRAGADRRLFEA